MSDSKTHFSILRQKKLCFLSFMGEHLSVNWSKFKDYKCKKCSAKHDILVSSRQAIPVATPVDGLQNTNTTESFNNVLVCARIKG